MLWRILLILAYHVSLLHAKFFGVENVNECACGTNNGTSRSEKSKGGSHGDNGKETRSCSWEHGKVEIFLKLTESESRR